MRSVAHYIYHSNRVVICRMLNKVAERDFLEGANVEWRIS